MEAITSGVYDNIILFYNKVLADQYHRYRSWEHCYMCFQRLRSARSNANIDTATLHLAFYLASWGMYRGSSRLLQKDYRVHTEIVQEILGDQYDSLWRLDFNELNPQVSLVIQLAEGLRRIYSDLQISPTDTLVTKVLLGTLGCIPAYDTLFIRGVTYWNQELPADFKPKFPAHFGINSYRGLTQFCCEHKNELEKAQGFIAEHGITYPVMKLVDMYFWNLGYQLGR